MKILKAKIYLEQDEGQTTYIYPQEWLNNKEKIPAVLYPQDRSDQGTDERGTYQLVFPVVPDDVAVALLKYPEFSVADRSEVISYADKHIPPVEKITDSDAVIKSLVKLAAGQQLSLNEKNAINPENPAPGIVLSKSWLDSMEELYGKLA